MSERGPKRFLQLGGGKSKDVLFPYPFFSALCLYYVFLHAANRAIFTRFLRMAFARS
jgi:hypothetical protein